MANKTVMLLDMHCQKCKKVALHCVTKIEGIDSLSIDMKEKTLTVIGDADPVSVANLVRTKFRCAKLLHAGPLPVPPPEPEEEKASEENKAEGTPEPEEEKASEENKAEEKQGEAEKPKEEQKEENPEEEQKEEKNREENKEEREEETKEEKSGEGEVKETGGDGKKAAETAQTMWYPVCEAQCYPPYAACSSEAEIMWPRYYHPRTPNEIVYVWSEDKQDSCIIM